MVEGQARTFSVFNATDTPHGFSIAEAGVAVVLEPGKETRFQVPALKEGIYRIFCQLHPPHRSGQLLVVEGD